MAIKARYWKQKKDPAGLMSDCWLASANGIRDGWPGCNWWLASTNGIQDGWPGCGWILVLGNDILHEWSSLNVVINYD
jgi:hypothetical protein